MARYDYDLFTIGAGSGGVRASRVSAGLGARVAVAEARQTQHREKEHHRDAVVEERLARDLGLERPWRARRLQRPEDRDGIGGRDQCPEEQAQDEGHGNAEQIESEPGQAADQERGDREADGGEHRDHDLLPGEILQIHVQRTREEQKSQQSFHERLVEVDGSPIVSNRYLLNDFAIPNQRHCFERCDGPNPRLYIDSATRNRKLDFLTRYTTVHPEFDQWSGADERMAVPQTLQPGIQAEPSRARIHVGADRSKQLGVMHVAYGIFTPGCHHLQSALGLHRRERCDQ